MTKQINIGLFGFGCVGQGFYDAVAEAGADRFRIKRIGIRDAAKPRTVEAGLFTSDPYDILDDPEIDLVVEAIDDAQAALRLAQLALHRNKPVVTASKKMVAENLTRLLAWQEATGPPVLYEAAVCGSIPVIRLLDSYYGTEELNQLSGIFNGSSNYVLSRIWSDQQDLQTAVKQAQDLGFAEADPTLDLGGFDAAYKLTIGLAHAFGTVVHPNQLLTLGLEALTPEDIRFARAHGRKIKLRVQARQVESGGLEAYVAPTLVSASDPLHDVENELNAVHLAGSFSGPQVLHGKGAGSHPTGAALWADVAALADGYRYRYTKAGFGTGQKLDQSQTLLVYLGYRETSDLSALNDLKVQQRGEIGARRYVVGEVPIRELLAFRSTQVFVAVLGQPWEPSSAGVAWKHKGEAWLTQDALS